MKKMDSLLPAERNVLVTELQTIETTIVENKKRLSNNENSFKSIIKSLKKTLRPHNEVF